MRIVLIASLALNLALGAALGQWIWKSHHHERPKPMHEGPPMFRPDALRGALSPQRADVVDGVLARHRDAMHSRIQQLRLAREAVQAAMLAEPFQSERLDAAFADLRRAESDTASEAHAMLAEVTALAKPDERERLAELMKGRHPRNAGASPHQRESRH